jgi:hypothetical protein
MATSPRPWPRSGAAGPGAGYLTGAKMRDLPQTMAAQRLPNMLRLGWAELLVDGKVGMTPAGTSSGSAWKPPGDTWKTPPRASSRPPGPSPDIASPAARPPGGIQ